MAAKLRWFGNKVRREVRVEIAKRLNVAGEYLRGRIVRNISTPTRSAGPSAPGEMPHADTGKLRQSVFSTQTTPDELMVVVGTALVYGRYLEANNNRTYLVRTLYEERKNLERIMAKGRGGQSGNLGIGE